MNNSVKAILLACMLLVTVTGLVWAGGKAEAMESYDYLHAAQILQSVVGLNGSSGRAMEAAVILAGGRVSDSDAVPADTPATERPATPSELP